MGNTKWDLIWNAKDGQANTGVLKRGFDTTCRVAVLRDVGAVRLVDFQRLAQQCRQIVGFDAKNASLVT
jgi:hypothetical protein